MEPSAMIDRLEWVGSNRKAVTAAKPRVTAQLLPWVSMIHLRQPQRVAPALGRKQTQPRWGCLCLALSPG